MLAYIENMGSNFGAWISDTNYQVGRAGETYVPA